MIYVRNQMVIARDLSSAHTANNGVVDHGSMTPHPYNIIIIRARVSLSHRERIKYFRVVFAIDYVVNIVRG